MGKKDCSEDCSCGWLNTVTAICEFNKLSARVEALEESSEHDAYLLGNVVPFPGGALGDLSHKVEHIDLRLKNVEWNVEQKPECPTPDAKPDIKFPVDIGCGVIIHESDDLFVVTLKRQIRDLKEENTRLRQK